MTTYICKCGRRVKKSTDTSTTGNRLSGYAPGHECWGCPYAMPYGNFQWDESAKTVAMETRGYECRMSKTLTYASEFSGSIKDKCTCRVHSLDFDFLSQVSAWIKDTYPDREIFGSFSKDIRASDYGSDGRYCLTITCAQNLKGVAAKRELLGQFFTPNGSRKDMTPQQEMEKILADIKKAKEVFACAPAQNADATVTTAENAAQNAAAATPTTSENAADVSASASAVSPQACGSAPAALADGSSAPLLSMTGDAPQEKPLTFIREDKCPEFDYSDLPEQTVATLHLAENGYLHGKKLAEKGLVYMGDNIALAHDELCGVVAQCDNSKHGNRGEDSFRAWCLHIGITKDSAYRLLQVSALLADSSPRQQAILESLPPTLLYAVAKPSAPPELVEKVKNGEVTTNKAYQDLLKENQQLRTDRVEAMNQADRERARADRAESERDKARADQLSTAKDCNRLGLKASQEKDRADKAEARAKNAEDALKKQPIVGVTDPEEVRRQADALAAEAKAQARRQIEDAQRRTREAEARYQKLQQDADGFLAPEQSCAQQAKIIADSMRSMYLGWFGLASTTGTPLARMAAPIYQVCDEIRESLEEDTTINPTAEGSVEDAEREALFE